MRLRITYSDTAHKITCLFCHEEEIQIGLRVTVVCGNEEIPICMKSRDCTIVIIRDTLQFLQEYGDYDPHKKFIRHLFPYGRVRFEDRTGEVYRYETLTETDDEIFERLKSQAQGKYEKAQVESEADGYGYDTCEFDGYGYQGDDDGPLYRITGDKSEECTVLLDKIVWRDDDYWEDHVAMKVYQDGRIFQIADRGGYHIGDIQDGEDCMIPWYDMATLGLTDPQCNVLLDVIAAHTEKRSRRKTPRVFTLDKV